MSLKSVLVTGCSAGGIGAAIATALAQRGHHVFATARTVSKIPADLSALSNVTPLQLDVASQDTVTSAAAAVAASGRGLDVLVNNAGAGYAMPVLDIDISRAQQLYEVNLWGPVRMVQAFAELLIERRGRVVNISSVGAVVNTPWLGTYSSSKAALTSFSETMRLELAPFGVSVVAVMVGSVDSNFHENEAGFALPASSRYASVLGIITGWVDGSAIPRGCSAARFAEMVVDGAVLSGSPGVVYLAPYAGTFGALARWAPSWVFDIFRSQNQGLRELRDKVNEGRA